MALAAGTQLGPYEILAPIGAGGMGEVYRARDTRLGRDVAVKVSAVEFTERFEREARVIASLNHTNVCHLYDVGPNYLVMELVEGETLAGPLRFDEALPLIRQLIDGIEAAHDRNIVHRDLKPANIKITHDGVVKILDFGLAKASAPEPEGGSGSNPEHSPTMTIGATTAGTILGTAAYMAPEQAKGKTADRRSDIWAFGVVVYELLTGKRPFQGESVVETLAAVINQEPDWSHVPDRAHRLLKWCLEKDRKRRLQSIGDARRVLEEIPDNVPAAVPQSRLALVSTIAAAIFAVIAGIALWNWLRATPAKPQPIVRLTTTLPESVVTETGYVSAPVLSRDGSRIAFAGGPNRQIYVRDLDQLDFRALPGTEGAGFLCFSPDGQWISYTAEGQPRLLKKVAVAGGPPQTLAESATLAPPSQDWGPDDNILFATGRGALARIASTGGRVETLATPDPQKQEAFYLGAQWLPESAQILVGISSGAAIVAPPKVIALNPKNGQRKTLLEDVEMARFVPGRESSVAGYLLYADLTTGSLMAVPFDEARLEVKGSPVPVLDSLRFQAGPFAAFSVADSGTLAYMPGGPATDSLARTLVWVDRKGVEQALPAAPRAYETPSISPDGGRVAVTIPSFRGRTALSADIWVYDLARNAPSRVTFGGLNINPSWTPDGKRLIYSSGPNTLSATLVSGPADGATPPTPLINDGVRRIPYSVSADGKFAIGHLNSIARTGNDFWVLPLADLSAAAGPKPQSFLDSRSTKSDAQFSPDGHWVAYYSNESGTYEVHVASFPKADQKFTISIGGGTTPRWTRSGRELFYRSGNKMMAVDIETSPTFRAGAPKELFGGVYIYGFDVSPDGQRFLMVKPPNAQSVRPDQLVMVVNWMDELRRRVPIGK